MAVALVISYNIAMVNRQLSQSEKLIGISNQQRRKVYEEDKQKILEHKPISKSPKTPEDDPKSWVTPYPE